ncbi:hypothetical protein HPB50_014136 [Hyalomma asiaticum]|uniref:Uncharacterized protein n=1 Tax=Hyalomma asiaticum TaxID=266040 RepID=A0ACB7SKW6_HYAAI|nr:hypothetical protein HPB50_014136 [Hyalomma asiaticum]
MSAEQKGESHVQAQEETGNRDSEENRVLDEYLVQVLSLDSQEMMEQLAALDDEGPRAPGNTGASATPDVGAASSAAGRRSSHVNTRKEDAQEKGDTTGCAEPRPRSILSASMLSVALVILMLVAIAAAIAYAIVFRGGRALMRQDKMPASLPNDSRAN